MRRPRSLRAIAVAYAVALSVATILTGGAVYLALIQAIDRAVDKRLESEARELLSGAPGEWELVSRIAAETQQRDSADIGFLLEQRGVRIAGNIRPLPLPDGASTVGRSAGIPGLTRGRALVLRLPQGARLTLVAESEPIDQHDRARLLILAGGFGMILLIIAAGTLALTIAIRRNIESVRLAAEAIVEGDLRARVPADRPGSAFGRQALAFNRMLDRIGELMASLRTVSNDIAHDLRTPLSRLHGRLVAVAAKPEAEPLRPLLAQAVAESEELLALFAAILRIAEVEGGDRRAAFTRIDLAALAEETVGSLEAMVSESGRALRMGPWEPAAIEGDARLLVQLIVNLVENAVSHTPPGTTIAVSVRNEQDRASLTVADDGPGIAPDERSLALRRFGRLDRSRHEPGHGLGLPMAEAVARLHRGRLSLEDAAPGLRVRVEIPLSAG